MEIESMIIPYIGYTAKEAAEALSKVMRLLPPPGETEVELIKRNPNLSWFQKWRLIRMIKKAYAIMPYKSGFRCGFGVLSS